MAYLEEHLPNITEFAKYLLSKKEVAMALEIDYEIFLNTPEYMTAYTDGVSTAVAAHKKKVQVLAEQGSSPAQNLFEKLRQELLQKDIDDKWE